jgi:hypothetical protein
MTRLLQRAGLAALLLLVGGTVAFASLAGYVNRPDPEFRWSKQSESMVGNVKVINLKVRSQVWRGIPWDHQVQIFVPNKITHPKTAFLLVTGGNPGSSDTLLGATVAPRLEAPAIILYNIPNQPLFEGKLEDDLIAHTFQEYLKSGDDTWPLLFPMVKSVTRTMDAVQALSRKEWAAPVEDFMVTGASKRGWTTWLTAAEDTRVRAIAPMVFDNLNFARQMPRQLELWGKYSEQIDDYSRRGTAAADGNAGREEAGLHGGPLVLPPEADDAQAADQRRQRPLLGHGRHPPLLGRPCRRQVPALHPQRGARAPGHHAPAELPVGFFHATAAGKEFPKLTASQRTRRGSRPCGFGPP